MKRRAKTLLAVLGAMAFVLFILNAHLEAQEKKQEMHPDVDFSVSCMECHQEVTPDVVKDWKSSKHGMMNFGCYMCHGDGQQEFYPQPTTEKCLSCHTGVPVDARKGGNLNCFTCHKGHTLKFHQ